MLNKRTSTLPRHVLPALFAAYLAVTFLGCDKEGTARKKEATRLLRLLEKTKAEFSSPALKNALDAQSRSKELIVAIFRHEYVDENKNRYLVVRLVNCLDGIVPNHGCFWVFSEENTCLLYRIGFFDDWELGYEFDDKGGVQLLGYSIYVPDVEDSFPSNISEAFALKDGKVRTICRFRERGFSALALPIGKGSPLYHFLYTHSGTDSTFEWNSEKSIWVLNAMPGYEKEFSVLYPTKFYRMIWKKEKASLEKHIPLLAPFEECLWYEGQGSNDSGEGPPVPGERFVKGFIKIDEETSKALQKKYPWSSASVDLALIDKPAKTSKPTASTLADPFVSRSDFLESKEFMAEHGKGSSFSKGRIIFSPGSRVVFFDLKEPVVSE